MTPSPITVEMLDGDHPLIRFPIAFASRATPFGQHERITGQINVSIQTLEEAMMLRDALVEFCNTAALKTMVDGQ